MKNWMKNIICSREWTDNGSGMDRAKSRMTTVFHRLTPDPILCRFCLASLIWIIICGFPMSAWGYEYVLENAGGNPGKNTNEGELVYETPIFENTDGIDQISYTYNSFKSGDVPTGGLIVEYSLDGTVYSEWNTKDGGHDTDVTDAISADHPARNAVRFRFKARGENAWRDVWSLNIRKSSEVNVYSPIYAVRNGASRSADTDASLTISTSQIVSNDYVCANDGNDVKFTLHVTNEAGNSQVNISVDNKKDWMHFDAEKSKHRYAYLSWEAPAGYFIKVTKVTIYTRHDGKGGAWCSVGGTAGDGVGTDIRDDSNDLPVSGINPSGFPNNRCVIDYYRNGTTGAFGSGVGQFNIKYIKVSYQLSTHHHIFGFATATDVNNDSYGSVTSSVKDTIQAAVRVSSASATATFTATPETGCGFLGWYNDDDYTDLASEDNPYTPTLTNNTAGSRVSRTLYAKFTNKSAKSITWGQTINDTVRSAVLTMTATATGGESVSYSVSPANLVSISGNVITCLKAGKVTITASSAETEEYFAAEDVEKKFTIYPHAITTTPSASGTLTYEQKLSTISPTGGVVTDNIAGSWAWKYPNSVPGAGTANQVAVFTPSSSVIDTVPLECNVSVTVNKATPEVTCSVNASTHYVDDTKIDLQSTWTREGDGVITYSVLSFEASGTNNDDGTTPYVESNRYLHLGKAGTAKVKMGIAAGTNYVARNETIDVVINKLPNTLKCAWDGGDAGDDWDAEIGFDTKYRVKFSSTNTSGPAITVTQSPASDVATYKAGAGGEAPDTIISNYRKGDGVTWTVIQPEDYKYVADTATCTVDVGPVSSPSGNIIKLYDNHNSSSDVKCSEFGEHVIDAPLGHVVKIYFEAKRTDGWTNSVTPKQKVNGEWITAESKVEGSLEEGKYKNPADSLTYFKKSMSPNATAIKFETSDDARTRLRHVFVTGTPYLSLENAGRSEISSITLPKNYKGGHETRGKFYVDFGTCANTIKLVSSHSRLTFAASSSTTHSFSTGSDHHGLQEIEVIYTSPADDEADINATITVYTPYEHETLTVHAVTLDKLTTTLEYLGSDAYSITNDDIAATSLFQVRDVNNDLVASPVITLSSSDDDVIDAATDNTKIDFVCGGSARITASYGGDTKYAAASNSGTIYHDITVNKLSDAITWKDGYIVGVNDTIRLYAGSTLPKDVATAQTRVNYESSNDTYLKVTNGATIAETTLEAKKHGTITLTATSTGDCDYVSVNNSKTVVIDPCVHNIVWEQSLVRFVTDEKGAIDTVVMLNAYAVDSLGSPTSKAITYSLEDEEFASIVGNVLTLKRGAGETVITATTAADDKYEIASASKTLRIRRFGEGCDSEVTDLGKHKLGFYDNRSGIEYAIAPSDTIYVKIGRQSGITCAYISIFGYDANSVETELAKMDPDTLLNDGKNYVLPIDEKYRKIKFRATGRTGWDTAPGEGGTQYKWYSDLHIKQKKYFRHDLEEVSIDDLKVGDAITPQVVTVDFSDVPNIHYRYTGAYLTLTPNTTVDNDCGGYGSYTFTLAGSIPVAGTYDEYIYITTSAADSIKIPVHLEVSTDGSYTINETNWSEDGDAGRITSQSAVSVASSTNVTISSKVSVYSLAIPSSSSITIAPTGGLTVGAGGITGEGMGNITLQVSEAADATKGQTAFLRISPEYTGAMPEVTMEMFSIAYMNTAARSITWQYLGSPLADDVAAKTVFDANCYVSKWNESTGKWESNRNSITMEPFIGYSVSQKKESDGLKMSYQGQIVDGREIINVPLSYTEESPKKGINVLCNSFSAPIDISLLEISDFPAGAEATINFFNTGSKEDIENRNGKSVDLAAAGQYISVPVGNADYWNEHVNYPIVIPSMQGFYVTTTAAGNLRLDYRKLVWEANYTSHPNKPLRAPKKGEESEEYEVTGSLRMTLSSEDGNDDVVMLESQAYETWYENGYDAYKLMSGNLNIYTIEDGETLAADATSSIEGTQIGIRTSDESLYTISFSHVNTQDDLALLDKELNVSADIIEGGEYMFYAVPNETIEDRFEIVTRSNAPAITTGTDGVGAEVKAQKFIKNNSLYIYKDGVLYNALGERVR